MKKDTDFFFNCLKIKINTNVIAYNSIDINQIISFAVQNILNVRKRSYKF